MRCWVALEAPGLHTAHALIPYRKVAQDKTGVKDEKDNNKIASNLCKMHHTW